MAQSGDGMEGILEEEEEEKQSRPPQGVNKSGRAVRKGTKRQKVDDAHSEGIEEEERDELEEPSPAKDKKSRITPSGMRQGKHPGANKGKSPSTAPIKPIRIVIDLTVDVCPLKYKLNTFFKSLF